MQLQELLVNSELFSIFIFILIVSANFLAEVFPCRLQYSLRNNMVVKHLFGLFTMMFFVVLSSNIKNKSALNVAVSAFLLYLLFILISKTNIYLFYSILILLGTTYIINFFKTKFNEDKSENENNNSVVESKNANYDMVTYMCYVAILIFTILGVLVYMGEKKIEYKKDFNYITFFLGKPKCVGKSPNVSLVEAFTQAFK